jgi:FAD:protein FMN transferase
MVASADFKALGTGVRVLATNPAALSRAVAAVESELAAIDLACSRFRDDSELSRLNRLGGGAVEVSPLLFAALEAAVRACRMTGGAVDPTMGRAIRILGYDRDFSQLDRISSPPPSTCDGGDSSPSPLMWDGGDSSPSPLTWDGGGSSPSPLTWDGGGSSPSPSTGEGRGGGAAEQINIIVQPAAGAGVIEMDRSTRTVRVHGGHEIDLGATAKALAVDRAARAAHAAAGCGVLVSVGGDLATAGDSPREGWPILVADDHAAPLDSAGEVISLRSGALATSSTTVRRWRHRGIVRHHILDPRTGISTREHWRTVSVVARTCVDANTAATAAVVWGEAAIGWLGEHRLPARLVEVDGSVTYVAGWPAPVLPPPSRGRVGVGVRQVRAAP